MNVKDLSYQRFGRLTVTPKYEMRKSHAYWLCRCDCGGLKFVRGSHLRSGNVTSCGCLKGNITHGGSNTRLYNIWIGMRNRCINHSDPQYQSYGGRGIQICNEWQSFPNFRDWAMSNGYSRGLSIDRIDNDGGYCPENCRWATPLEQANNTRKNHLITFNGETHSLSEWARLLNIKQSTLSMRINNYGWSVEKALGKDARTYGT